MMNNVIIASLAKGQLIPVLVFFAFITMIVKMPSQDVSSLMFSIFSGLETGKLVGYAGALGLTGGWYYHARWQRRAFEAEMRRITEERDAAQARVLPSVVESSRLEGPKKRRKES